MTMLVAGLALLPGCVRRTIFITSEPEGALVYLNDTEVGRTPVEVDFLYYGDYDVRLIHPDREPLVTMGRARAPWWDTIGLDLIAEAAPGEPHARIHWHYELPERNDDPAAMLERARALRERAATVESRPADAESREAAPPQ